MKVYRVIKPFSSRFGDWNIGDRFFQEPYDSVPGTHNYYPGNGSYALWDKEGHWPNILDYLEFIEETDKPKEYFIRPIYTQEQWDKKNQSPNQ